MSIGIRISKDGYDVNDTDEINLIYSSVWGTLNIYKQGEGKTNGSGIATVSHGLNYQPAFLVYDTDSPYDGTFGLNHESYVDATNLNVVSTANTTYKYIIFSKTVKEGATTTQKPSAMAGAAISGSGNVYSADHDNLDLHSESPPLQVFDSTTIDLDLVNDDQFYETGYEHNFGWIPAYGGLVAVSESGVYTYRMASKDTQIVSSFPTKATDTEVYVDNQKVYLRAKTYPAIETPPGAYVRATIYLLNKI